MAQQLLPKALIEALARQFPALYSQEHNQDPMVLAHFFSPANGWNWYVYEGSPVDEDGYYDADKEKVDFLFFGLVCGFEDEIGYISMAELLGVVGRVERDLSWQPKTLSEVRADVDKRRASEPEPEEPQLSAAAAAERERFIGAVQATWSAALDQPKLVAHYAALGMGERIGWHILAHMPIGEDIALVPLCQLNDARHANGMPPLTKEQEADYKATFVRVLRDKLPQDD